MGSRAFGAGLAACSAAAVVAQAQAVAVQQAQQQGSGLAAGLAALGYGGSPLGALGSPAQLQNTGTPSLRLAFDENLSQFVYFSPYPSHHRRVCSSRDMNCLIVDLLITHLLYFPTRSIYDNCLRRFV